MRKLHRSFSLVTVAVAVAFAIAPAGADPKTKPKPATTADVDRLEKRIEEQQKVIDKLVKVQQLYLQALNGTLDVPPPPPAPAPDKPPVNIDKPAPPPTPAATDKKPVKPAPRAAIDKKPTKEDSGMGTVVGKVSGVGDAIIYIEDVVMPVKSVASMRQEGKEFVPQVLVVTKGTTVQFPNRDAIFHNVFSMTPDNSFDLGSYKQGESKSVTMSRPGVVTVYCNMHPQMVGHILVTPNSNYVRAGKDGFFRLSNVPAGSHRVVAWAPNAKPTVVQANVEPDQVVTVELGLRKGGAAQHLKKDGLPYGSYDK